jgi:hypothetical protein
MKPYHRFVSFLVVVLMAITSFSPGLTAHAQSSAQIPTGGLLSLALAPIIPNSTHVLSKTTTQYALKASANESSTLSTYTFSQATAELTNVHPGDIIVSDASDLYPNGFLRKVDAVNYSNGRVILQTSSAALDEAIQQGEVNYAQTLNLNKAQSSFQVPGVKLVLPSSTTEGATVPRLNITNVVIYDNDGNTNTKNDQILANGYVEFQPTINFSMKVQNWKVQNLSFTTTGNENAQLKLEYKFNKSFLTAEKTLAKYTLPSITVFVGIVPVVLTPVLRFGVGTNGKVSVGVSAGVSQQLSFKYGVQYNGTTWSPIANLTKSFSPIKPSLLGSLDLKGFANAEISLMIYGVAGPYVKVEVYLKLHANISEVPWWKLFAGLDVPVGVRVEVLGHKLVDYSKTVVALQVVIAQAPLPTKTPTRTATKIPTKIPTRTVTRTPTKTASKTSTTVHPTLTLTVTKTASPTIAFVPTSTPTPTPTGSLASTNTPTLTLSPIVETDTPSPVVTNTKTPTMVTETPTATPNISSTPSKTITATSSVALTPTSTPTVTPSITPTKTLTLLSITHTVTPSLTNTITPTITMTPTIIPTPMIVEPSLLPAYSATCGTPPSYWWKNPNGYTGYNGTSMFLTMNAQRSSQSTNIATFHLNIPLTGQYKIEAYVAYHPSIKWPCTNVSIYGDTSKANYQVHHSTGTNTVLVDQLPLNNAWANLGTFRFNAGTAGSVVLPDLTGEAFSVRFVSVNVIRITWVGP